MQKRSQAEDTGGTFVRSRKAKRKFRVKGNGNSKLADRLFRFSVLLILICAVSQGSRSEPSKSPELQTATGWFQRADGLTNLRLPGSAPFLMKVTFHAYPGIDLSQPGRSPIITGDGTYEETWLAPDKWRREVTLGGYHAVEVRAAGVRKFQASSDYEPSRVLMLLDALLDPIPRTLLSPELEMAEPKWKLDKSKKAGSLVVLFHFNRNSQYIPASSSYEFSLGGFLLRAVSAGLVTTWQEQQSFAGKWFPRTLSVGTRRNNLLTAVVSLNSPGKIAEILFQLPGSAADPGLTIRPLQYYEVKPPSILPTVLSVFSLAETGITGLAVVDRHGVPHEVEALGHVNGSIGKDWVDTIRQERFAPATIDGSPCEFLVHFLPSTGPSFPPTVFQP